MTVEDSDSPASEAAAPRQRRRRSTDRSKRDPERTRAAILQAAKTEFGEHGYEKARVARIAAAAGLNHQLITYHFGGKQGLYDALTEEWLRTTSNALVDTSTYGEVVREAVGWGHSDEGWVRMIVREGLEGGFPIGDKRVARLIEIVEKTRLHQKKGELRDHFDAGAVTLAIFAAAIAPVTFPAFARAFVGLDPSSDAFFEMYADQLQRIVVALAGSPAPGSA
ncbi:TetR/AcrR family transcriptional regulator [Rhodococcus qingshengii]|uniref:TetR/AcrR family transcriptional regulator n=1 Tax=Rhodococcus qingshengii TaxID=334542 RepID=UPI001BE98DE4|nr:TetR/AcrR family transcriptional regulator [Rhodococcus qingshengii]MBT2269957.1 TetR/AcrR family transcriptional regulator [Rhodococcus qingshengii]